MTLFGLAHRFLKSRAIATALSILCVALAVGIVIALESVPPAITAGSVEPAIRAPILVAKGEASSRLVMASVFLEPPAPPPLPSTVMDIIHAEPGILKIIPLWIEHGDWEAVVATTRDYFQQGQNRLVLNAGRIFQSDEVNGAVLGYSLAKKKGVGIGELFEDTNMSFRIVGVLSETGTPVDRAIFIPFSKQTGQVTAVVIIPGEEFSPEDLQARLQGTEARVIDVNATLRRLVMLVGAVEQIVNWVIAAIIAMTLILFCSAMYANMRERVRDLAILRIIGAKRLSVVALLSLESGMIGLIGAIGGLLVAELLLSLTRNVLGAAGFSFLPHLDVRSLWIAILGFLTTMSVGSLIAIAIYRIDPIRALSSTNRPWHEILGRKGRTRVSWARLVLLTLLITLLTAVFFPTPQSRPINDESKQLFNMLERWDGKGPPSQEITQMNDKALTVEGYPYLPFEPRLGGEWRSGFFIVRDDPNQPIELFHEHDQKRPEENQKIWIELKEPIEPTLYPVQVRGTFHIQPVETKAGLTLYRLVDASAKIIAFQKD